MLAHGSSRSSRRRAIDCEPKIRVGFWSGTVARKAWSPTCGRRPVKINSARWSSAQVGEREVSRTQVGASAGPREVRDGFTIHPQRVIESAALPSEIQMLQPFQGYLCITGHRRAIVEFFYLAPIIRQAGFVQRLTTEDQAEADSAPPSADCTQKMRESGGDGRRDQRASQMKRPLA